jgi:hypothetical protein
MATNCEDRQREPQTSTLVFDGGWCTDNFAHICFDEPDYTWKCPQILGRNQSQLCCEGFVTFPTVLVQWVSED